jgi:hypothetical protein
MGQTRRCDDAPFTSGLPTDIGGIAERVSTVPTTTGVADPFDYLVGLGRVSNSTQA